MAPQDGTKSGRSEHETLVALATELFTIVRRHLSQLGIDEASQLSAFEQSNESDLSPVSGGVMREVWGLAELLTEWSRAPEYSNANGQARVLRIKGPGATFETLARRFLPGKTVAAVIEFAKQTTEIVVMPRNRIALLGSILVTPAIARETLLAHTVRHADFLLSTLTRNAALPAEDRQSKGYMERMVVGVIHQDRMADFVQQLRPQIYELLMQFDTAVEQRAPKDAADVAVSTTAAIGVYLAEEPNWARTGVDPGHLTSK